MSGRQASKSNAGVGLVPRADQLEFDKEEKRVEQFETANEKFYRDVKSYIKKIDELCKSENKLISDLTHTIANASAAAAVTTSNTNTAATTTNNNTNDQSDFSSSWSSFNNDSEQAFIRKLKVTLILD